MTKSQRQEAWLIDKIDAKSGIPKLQIIKPGKFARKCSASWSKTHIVSIEVRRRRKVVV